VSVKPIKNNDLCFFRVVFKGGGYFKMAAVELFYTFLAISDYFIKCDLVLL